MNKLELDMKYVSPYQRRQTVEILSKRTLRDKDLWESSPKFGSQRESFDENGNNLFRSLALDNIDSKSVSDSPT